MNDVAAFGTEKEIQNKENGNQIMKFTHEVITKHAKYGFLQLKNITYFTFDTFKKKANHRLILK